MKHLSLLLLLFVHCCLPETSKKPVFEKYSEKYAYKDKPFPFTENDARCVLCQQILLEEAQKRMISFEEYLKGEMQKAAELAKERLENASKKIDALIICSNSRFPPLPHFTHLPLSLFQTSF